MEFKVGDRVRRIAGTVGCRPGKKTILQNDVVGVTSINVINGETFLRFFNETMGYSSSGFELVENAPAVKTSQELADEYRAVTQRIRDIRAELSERGFTLYRQGNDIPMAPHPAFSPSDYYFEKTVKETL